MNQLLHQVATVVGDRQTDRWRRRHGVVLVDRVYADPHTAHLRARVSCDQGRTWGWHRISRAELAELPA